MQAFSIVVAPRRPGSRTCTASKLDDRDTPLDVDALSGFRVGARVRLKARSGALVPASTGHGTRVAYGPGQVGVVERFVRRNYAKQDMQADLAVVRWDAQTWYEWDIPLNRMQEGKSYGADDLNKMNAENGKAVQLGSFEDAASPEVLEWIGGTALAPVAATPRAKPTHTKCKPPLHTVPGTIVTVRDGDQTQAIADELAKKLGFTLDRVWPGLASWSAKLTPAQLEQVLRDDRLSDVSDNCSG